MKITYIGHACLLIEGQNTILTDPFISGNSLASCTSAALPHINYILLSHGHGDHLGDTEQIVKRDKSTVIAPVELAGCLSAAGTKAHPMNFGSKEFEFGRLSMVSASHSSSTELKGNTIYLGNPCGYIIRTEGKSIYFAGDTGLISDMQLLASERLDAAFLPTGGNFTMDAADAIKAKDMIQARITVPIHYDTFPIIKLSSQDRQKLLQAGFTFVKPGDSIEL